MDEARVGFDREDVTARLGERDGERSEAAPDLQDAVAGTDAGVRDDRAREVGVGEEVLAERLGRADAVTGGEILQRGAAETPAVTR